MVTATAASAEWMRSGGNDRLIQYVDTATIQRNGNLVKMWGLVLNLARIDRLINLNKGNLNGIIW